jgi:hypothetical protein
MVLNESGRVWEKGDHVLEMCVGLYPGSLIAYLLVMVVPGVEEAALELRRASCRKRLLITSDFMQMGRGEP